MLLDTPVCAFDWPAPDFTLKDAHGTAHSMKNHLTDKGLLVMFICNHCPYVQAIADRLAADAQMLQEMGVGVLAVMSNDYHKVPADSPARMIDFARQYGFDFPYLVDEDQAVGQAYGAVCTPDFFGFNGAGGLQYRGRLDDVRMGGDASGRRTELLDAMRQIAETGAGPRQQVPSMGCSIKWR